MKNTIIFDGECNYCQAQIQKIQKRSKNNIFDYLPRQSPQLLQDFPELKPFEDQDGLRFIDLNKNVTIGADAVYQVYKRIPPFNWLTWAYQLPILKSIFKMIYQRISNNRYQLAGKCKDDICAIPYQQREN